jgi:hypothetical protein
MSRRNARQDNITFLLLIRTASLLEILEKNAAESPLATEYAIKRKTMARPRGPDPLSLSELVV